MKYDTLTKIGVRFNLFWVVVDVYNLMWLMLQGNNLALFIITCLVTALNVGAAAQLISQLEPQQ